MAFLYGKMEEEVFMSSHEGIEYIEDDWNRAKDFADLPIQIWAPNKQLYNTGKSSWKQLDQ
jgi:hypothetical protein